MPESEERQKQAMRLLEYMESKKAVALLRADARDVAGALEALAKSLRDQPELIDDPEDALPNPKQILNLTSKIRKATSELAERETLVRELGLDV